MRMWKSLLLNAYYHASAPVRAQIYRRMADEGRLPIIMFYWHRIADDQLNDWTTLYSVFVRQILWLKKHFEFVSLEEAQRRIREGENHGPAVCVTFDDGYAGNCERAIPFLIDERVPFAYFATVQNSIDGKPFAHDLKNGYCFAPNSLEQLRWMGRAGVEIGVHSMTHADLGAVGDAKVLRREIVESKQQLEDAIGRPVRYFAFPYGLRHNLSSSSFAMIREAGYAGACSAYGGYNFPGDDAFHLQRISADRSMIAMKNWATLDPRKLRVPRYEYFLDEPAASRGAADDYRAAVLPFPTTIAPSECDVHTV